MEKQPFQIQTQKHTKCTRLLRGLIIGDNRTSTPFFKTIFEQCKYELDISPKDDHEIRHTPHMEYDLILVNMDIVDWQNSDVISKLQSSTKETAVVSMTSSNTMELEAYVRSKRVAYHLIKPFERHELVSLLQHIAKRSHKPVTLPTIKRF